MQLTRDAGALTELPLALNQHAYVLLFRGELAAAASLVDEAQVATEATGSSLAPSGGLGAWQWREVEVSTLASATGDEMVLRGEGIGIGITEWAHAVLDNGLGRYDSALAAAERATAYPDDISTTNWALVELIEASVIISGGRAGPGVRRCSASRGRKEP